MDEYVENNNTYVSNMAGKNLTGKFKVSLLLRWEDTLLFVEPTRQLLRHAMTKILGHVGAEGGDKYESRGGGGGGCCETCEMAQKPASLMMSTTAERS